MSALGRGQALKSLKKQHETIAKAEAKGRLEGEAEAQRKKPIDVSIKEHIGKFIDNIRSEDIMKLVAWIGLAYIIKPLIDSSQEVSLRIQAVKSVRSALARGGAIPFIVMEQIGIFNIADYLISAGLPSEAIDKIKKEVEKEGPEHWLLALTTSACIIIYGPTLVSSLGGVTKLAGLLIS